MRVTDVVLRLLVDLAAIAVLALGLHYRRHGRRDLVVLYVLFNVGLFAALVAISAAGIGLGVGFGLFAVVRETTRVALRCRERPAEATVGPHELDARLGGLAG